MKGDSRIALVTGGNRGLGLETCRQLAQNGFKTILTARDWKRGRSAADDLKLEKLDVDFLKLDVTERRNINQTFEYIRDEFGKLDILINNAGIMLDGQDGKNDSIYAIDGKIGTLRDTMEVNVYAPMRLVKIFAPLLTASGHGVVVNVSSSIGQFTSMAGGYPAYRMSKTSLNALTVILADELRDKNIKVNAVCPGWVRTDMGGPNAERSVEEGAKGIVKMAMIPGNGPTGGFFRDGKPLQW